jgi:hypothetical protein
MWYHIIDVGGCPDHTLVGASTPKRLTPLGHQHIYDVHNLLEMPISTWGHCFFVSTHKLLSRPINVNAFMPSLVFA